MQTFHQLAIQLDQQDPLKHFQTHFLFPKNQTGENKIYLCGHSLGLQPKHTEKYIKEELDKWANHAVEGHFTGENPWLDYHETVTSGLVKLTGALNSEVIAMNSLTTNLHLLLVSFYRPTTKKFKILIEAGAFPSDRYAVHSQVQFHGFNIEEAIIEVPADNNGLFTIETFEKLLINHADEIALILLPGVQYKTGQLLSIQQLTQLAHRYQCKIGWDLAHAIGNVFLDLHQWQVDFAVWCHYKYLNAGPGAIGGCFVHENYFNDKTLPRFAGWWGHVKHSRFIMPELFEPIKSVEAWQLSNPPIFQLAALRASLEIFTSMDFSLSVKKSNQFTDFIRTMLQQLLAGKVTLVTPAIAIEHGAQLSLKIATDTAELVQRLNQKNIVCDFRPPNIIRIAPIPLYNSFADVYFFVKALTELL